MSVQLKSGSFKGSKEEFKLEVAKAVFNGAFQGMIRAVNKIQPNLAQRTGAFRTVFAQSAFEEVQSQFGQTKLTIEHG